MKMTDSKIRSIPGIGGILGPMILGEVGNIDRFSNAKKLVAFAGLDSIPGKRQGKASTDFNLYLSTCNKI
jgi:transposase